ncbi:MAG: glucose 1-dehydrogenase [Candidatus Poribacteria bacterium]|nr:glucose 1-dehydrogenase [Candidatus Poribacteria bacterium]
MRLKGKVTIITGAAGGIGRATVLRFAQEGARVVAADIDQQGAEETARVVPSDYPGPVTAHAVDVSRADGVERLISDTVTRFGRLDVIFSNAAIMRAGSVVDLSESDWDALFAANVKGAFLCGKYGIPAIRRNGGGSFIITASVNSFYAESDIAGYCATKGAVMQLTRAMAIDHGPEGVRVNCICPGWIETAMSQPFLDENPEGREFAGKIAPLGRIGQPEDVADVAVFLASDESRFVTGSAYTVDGGWTAGMTKALALI